VHRDFFLKQYPKKTPQRKGIIRKRLASRYQRKKRPKKKKWGRGKEGKKKGRTSTADRESLLIRGGKPGNRGEGENWENTNAKKPAKN